MAEKVDYAALKKGGFMRQKKIYSPFFLTFSKMLKFIISNVGVCMRGSRP